MKKIKNLLYISELSLPTESAQAVQTIKMCSAFSKYTNTDFSLFNTNISFQKLKKTYLIKNNFKLIPVFRSPKKLKLADFTDSSSMTEALEIDMPPASPIKSSNVSS